jgi:DNA-binding transcriptional ArsR family regulator
VRQARKVLPILNDLLAKSMQIKRQLMSKMHQSLASVLLPEYRRRVLGLLLLRPEEALHGREIARRTGLAAGTVTRELTKLAEVGLLRREKRGNQQLYSADKSCPVFTELASMLRKTSGMADVLAQALAPAAGQIRVAFVFGSVAQARETSGSDIDLMLIGDVGFGQAVQWLYPVQADLGREVNPKVFSVAEFAQKSASDPFLRDVLSKPKIFLIGGEHELAELAGHQP